MDTSFDLSKLNPDAFEHMVNALAMKVMGPGVSGFAPGADGGRDGFFEGDAPYPSSSDRWSGIWYIQSKFRSNSLSGNPQRWLLDRLKEEIHEFSKSESKRKWPNNWILATNIDPSGTPETGAFDRARLLVSRANKRLNGRFHIWGGKKIAELLNAYPEVAKRYGHFLTPGHVISQLIEQMKEDRADANSILQQLIVRKFKDQKLTKLEQAGSQSDDKPAIHSLFVDLPFRSQEHRLESDAMTCFSISSNETHAYADEMAEHSRWRLWNRNPRRARVWFLKGGPGQGKSTLGQYYCQIQRAALIANDGTQQPSKLSLLQSDLEMVEEVRKAADRAGFWPEFPRIPLHIELKDYAQWFGRKKKKGKGPKGILTYVAEELAGAIEQQVKVGTFKRLMKDRRWAVVFDGLDEVPEDLKDAVADEVKLFITRIAFEQSCDLLSLCTSRPQGYSGQFEELDCATIDLLPLKPDRALACARPVIMHNRPSDEANRAIAMLESSMNTPSIRELMTTPLQSHILAVVVRDGERPPDRRWKLYSRFYDVIRRREANRNLPDKALANLLATEERMLKTLHNRVGFILHANSETSEGAETNLSRDEFGKLARITVEEMVDENVESKLETLNKATIERLVLINTPDDGNKLRFDIRQLQEFFAAECLYDSVLAASMGARLEVIAGDAHWREVVHFLLSALVENNRRTELSVAVAQLVRINDGEDFEFVILDRRMGKGALLVARLFSEGVLEQDKAMRHCFRECLSPMLAFTNIERLQDLIAVRQENSKAWIIAYLLDKLNKLVHNENIGAAIVLAHILPDSHPSISVVTTFLQNSPREFLSTVINTFPWLGRFEYVGETPSAWFVSFLLNLLEDEEWSKLGGELVENILWIVQHTLSQGISAIGIVNDKLVVLLHLLYSSWQEQPSEDRIIMGNLRLIRRGRDGVDSLVAEIEDEVLDYDTSGVFRYAQVLLAFAKYRSRDRFISVLEVCSHSGLELLQQFTKMLGVPIPRKESSLSTSELISRIRESSDEEFAAFLKSNYFTVEDREEIGTLQFGFEPPAILTADDLKKCFRHSPQLALELIVVLRQHNFKEFEKSDTISEFVSEVLPLLEMDPGPLIAVPLCWPLLIETAPECRPELLSIIYRQCGASLPYRSRSSTSSLLQYFLKADDIVKLLHVYKYDRQPMVLPYVVDTILSHLRVFGVDARHAKAIISSVFNSDLEDSSDSLRALLSKQDVCWTVRCSAALFLLFNFDSGSDSSSLESISDEFLSHCNSGSGAWLLEGLVTVLTHAHQTQTPVITKLVRDLFKSCHNDYPARIMLERLLMSWRERSLAPVTSRGLRDKWLYNLG